MNYGGRVYGVSNVWAIHDFDPWPSLIADLHERRPGDTFVGYESGDDLARATAAGFRPIGALRIWVRQGSESHLTHSDTPSLDNSLA